MLAGHTWHDPLMFIDDTTTDGGMRRAILMFISDVATDECTIRSSVLKTYEHDLNYVHHPNEHE
jgi:hypothetical protein